MTERADNADDAQVRAQEGEPASAGPPEVSESEGSQAVAEGASEAVTPEPATAESVETPAPPVDASAATPDRGSPVDTLTATAEERPELLVGGAFVGGLALALILKRVAGD